MASIRNFKRDIDNLGERNLLGRLLSILEPPKRLSTIKWAEENRYLSSTESSITGKFDCSRTPAFEYLYFLCDNWYIHIVGCMKSSQVGASEMENNVIGKVMDLSPCNTVVFFPGTSLLKEYSKKRFQPFFNSCKVLKDKCNLNVIKPSYDFFTFVGGTLALKTLGSIQSVLSSPFPFIILEEFAQVKAEVAKQGDPLGLALGRQKSFHIGKKKVLGFSTPTFKDFCNMEKLYNKGNKLVFKAKCHHCEALVELSGWTMDNIIRYEEYQNRYIDELYGKHDPETAYFACLTCNKPWTFDDKTANIIAGKSYGFIDDCGEFTLGWHPQDDSKEIISIEQYRELEPTIDKLGIRKRLKQDKTSLIYTIQYPELLSCFEATSDATALAAKKITAELALAKGDETLAKDWANNSKGIPYASGVTAVEEDELKTFRLNYPEHIVPVGGLVLSAGVDVQIDRFAIIIRAWGRNGNSWIVSWFEIFGDISNTEDSVWQELTDRTVNALIPTASGKILRVASISIDSGDQTDLVYQWVKSVNGFNPNVRAVKGVRDLRYSDDEIYLEPSMLDVTSDSRIRKTLAETMGVTLYKMGTHRAKEVIIAGLLRNKNRDINTNVWYFNEQSYPDYEKQLTSCRKIIDVNSSYTKSVYKLKPGARKEALDCEGLALHAFIAIGGMNYTHTNWKAIEDYLDR